MAERSFDHLSFHAGLAACLGSGLYLLDRSGGVQVDEAVTGATLLIGLGAAGLLRAAARLVSRRGPSDEGPLAPG